MSELPELKSGDKVLITSHRYGETTFRGPHHIERETKTLLIVEGRKFRKRDHREHVAQNAWAPNPKLIPADSEEARNLIRADRISKARGKFRESVNRRDQTLTELQVALKSRDLLDTYIQLLTEDAK